ncbi:MAG: hypothetical protein H6907_12260 [Hyphomicrobiales bacterium]|nr:hypothetical protein [Hyphomicrobiales bacterium]
MTHRLRLAARLVALALLFAGPVPAAAGDSPLSAFYGVYAGEAAIERDDGSSSMRSLDVVIRPWERGFSVVWTTIRHRKDGSLDRKTHRVNFAPSQRDSIYRSAMKSDMFGALVPLDPLKGEPYIWSRIHGKTLTVYALHIRDDGGYEMQVYDRTLTDKGLNLTFSRWREGETVRVIKAFLRRQAG